MVPFWEVLSIFWEGAVRGFHGEIMYLVQSAARENNLGRQRKIKMVRWRPGCRVSKVANNKREDEFDDSVTDAR